MIAVRAGKRSRGAAESASKSLGSHPKTASPIKVPAVNPRRCEKRLRERKAKAPPRQVEQKATHASRIALIRLTVSSLLLLQMVVASQLSFQKALADNTLSASTIPGNIANSKG